MTETASCIAWSLAEDTVDLCEINYLASSLIDFCISTSKRSWLSPRRARFSNIDLRLGPVLEKAKAVIIHYSKSISDDPGYFISERSTLPNLSLLSP